MKKHNPLAVLILIAANLAVGCLTGIALGALPGIRGFNWMILITIPLFLLLFPNLTTAYMVGPFGGTRYVYFEFCHGNTRFRFPTFRTRTMWFVSSTHVQDAIATGENICNLLLSFNPSGADLQRLQ